MQYRRHVRKPGDRVFRPGRAKPWQVPLLAVKRVREAGPATQWLVYGFAGLIAFGTTLLTLPISSRTGQFTSPVIALFTATSAVCVTGLVVVDTATYWSPFGQTVLLLLFQLGGFGFMTSATMLFLLMGRRIGLRDRLLIGESLGMGRPGGMVRIARRAALFTLLVEGTGAIILFIRFLIQGNGFGAALWSAVFHAVSAFNNCGMDILGKFQSLLGYQGDATVVLTMAVLIILGGIGYVVVDDVLTSRSFSRLSTDTKIVLVTTASLLVLGTVFILLAEFSNGATIGRLPFSQKLLAAFFQSVTPRTAGFSVVDVGKMAGITLFFTMFLMFVGGASGSTAGGIKVNTFGVLISTALSSIRGRESTGAFGREITTGNVYRALALVMLYLGLVMVVVLGLSITEKFDFVRLLFETFSALGTVGLSTGITPELSVPGRLIITAAMFVGRLGPLTFLFILIERQKEARLRYPKDIIRIG